MSTAQSEIDALIERTNKRLKSPVLRYANTIQTFQRVSTGSLSYDLALGGGWPLNVWNEIIGLECLAPGTKILCADLTWQPIETLAVGDEIIGFDEQQHGMGKGRTSCYRRSEVTTLGRKTLPVYEITTPYGVTRASAGHGWLVHRNTPRGEQRARSVQRQWVRTEDLRIGERVASLGRPWETDNSWEAGYIAGFYDGEGSVGLDRVSCNQIIGPTCDRVLETLEKLGFTPLVRTPRPSQPHWQPQKTWTFPGRYEDMRFLGTIRPERLLEKSARLWEGRSTKAVHGSSVPVLDLRYVGEEEVVTIETSTRTLIADGLLSHNSHGKTVMAAKTIASAQSLDPAHKTLWIASEDINVPWFETLGVDTSRMVVAETNSMEDAYDIMVEWIDSKAVDAVVLDSYPALIPKEEEEKGWDDWQMGLGARLTNKLMRKSSPAQRREAGERDCLCLIINQWRDKIGVMFGDPRTTPGGKGKNFSYFTRVEVVREGFVEGPGKVKVGQTMKIRTMKNKTAPPNRVAVSDFYFDDNFPFVAGQYDTVAEVWNIATTYGIIERRGAWYHYGDQRWNGKEPVLASLREDLGFQREVDAQVRHHVLGTPLPTKRRRMVKAQ